MELKYNKALHLGLFYCCSQRPFFNKDFSLWPNSPFGSFCCKWDSKLAVKFHHRFQKKTLGQVSESWQIPERRIQMFGSKTQWHIRTNTQKYMHTYMHTYTYTCTQIHACTYACTYTPGSCEDLINTTSHHEPDPVNSYINRICSHVQEQQKP